MKKDKRGWMGVYRCEMCECACACVRVGVKGSEMLLPHRVPLTYLLASFSLSLLAFLHPPCFISQLKLSSSSPVSQLHISIPVLHFITTHGIFSLDSLQAFPYVCRTQLTTRPASQQFTNLDCHM